MEEYKTIHHLCTTPLSQALPLELQLASRACHTSSLLAAPPEYDQQRAALRHINSLPDKHRYNNICPLLFHGDLFFGCVYAQALFLQLYSI